MSALFNTYHFAARMAAERMKPAYSSLDCVLLGLAE